MRVTPHSGKLMNWDRITYDADTSRERSTKLKTMVVEPQGPRAYYRQHINPRANSKEEDSGKVDDKVLGSLLHEFMLEGRIGWYQYDGRADKRNAEYQEALENAAGRPIIKQQHVDTIHRWAETIESTDEAAELINGPRYTEQTAIWTETVEFDDGTTEDIECKAAIDIFTFDGLIGDLKTTRRRTRSSYERDVWDLRYDFSAAFYARGRRAFMGYDEFTELPFVHIVLMKGEPEWCYVWPFSDGVTGWMGIGNQSVEKALCNLAKCRREQRRLLEMGDDPIHAWPDFVREDHSGPMMPSEWVLSQFGFETAGGVV